MDEIESGAEGRFQLPEALDTFGGLRIEARDHSPRELLPHELGPDEPSIELWPAGSLWGTLRSEEDLAPLATSIHLRWASPYDRTARMADIPSRMDGAFRAEGIPLGVEVTLTVAALGHARWMAERTFTEPENRLDILLPCGLQVQGTCVDASGHPLVGVRITAESTGSPQQAPSFQTAWSLETGVFLLEGLSGGAYQLSFEWWGTRKSRSLHLDPCQDLDSLEIVLEVPSAIGATLVDPEGSPVPGVAIQVFGTLLAHETRSDEQGDFTVPADKVPSAGNLRVAAELDDGFQTAFYSLERDWVPRPTLRLEPLPLAMLRIEPHPPLLEGAVDVLASGPLARGSSLSVALQGGRGRVAIEAGEYDVVLQCGSGRPLARTRVSVDSRADPLLVIPWQAEHTVRGRVVRAGDHAPLPGARVLLSPGGGPGATQTADDAGAFQFITEYADAENTFVEARLDGWAQSDRRNLLSFLEGDERLVLSEPARLVIHSVPRDSRCSLQRVTDDTMWDVHARIDGGRHIFDDLPSGSYLLQLGPRLRTLTLQAGEERILDLGDRPETTWAGRAFTDAGGPITDWVAACLIPLSGLGEILAAEIAGDGKLTFEGLQAGEHFLLGLRQAPGAMTGTRVRVDLLGPAPQPFVLEESSLVVRNESALDALCLVELDPTDALDSLTAIFPSESFILRSVWVRAKDSLELSGLPRSRVVVHVSRGSKWSIHPVDVRAGLGRIVID